MSQRCLLSLSSESVCVCQRCSLTKKNTQSTTEKQSNRTHSVSSKSPAATLTVYIIIIIIITIIVIIIIYFMQENGEIQYITAIKLLRKNNCKNPLTDFTCTSDVCTHDGNSELKMGIKIWSNSDVTTNKFNTSVHHFRWTNRECVKRW